MQINSKLNSKLYDYLYTNRLKERGLKKVTCFNFAASNPGSGSDSCVLAHLLADPETGSESSESDVDNFCSGVLPNSASCSDEGEILEGNSEESDYGEETEPHPLPALEILNRFCLKIREEALLSNNAVERIRIVTVSLLKKTAQQSKDKVNKVLQDNGRDPSTMPELQDAFQPSSWEHGSAELIDRGDYRNFFPNISPQEITLGKRRQWKKL